MEQQNTHHPEHNTDAENNTPPEEPAKQKISRKKLSIIIAGTAVVVAAIGVTAWFLFWHNKKPATQPSTALNSSTTSQTKTSPAKNLTYKIVDTGQTACYSDTTVITCPAAGQPYYGQDAQVQGNQPSYTDNGNGTVTDNVTDLMWQKDMGQKMTLAQAEQEAKTSNLGGYHDWRVANIKELYSLINFTGQVDGQKSVKLFINTKYFDQPLGGNGTAIGDREIDAQTLSSTPSVAKTMNGDSSIFGVNFVDGRIKAYPLVDRATNQPTTKYFRLVRGNTSYGKNDFVDNHDGTITDLATGLMWQKADSGKAMDWSHALSYANNLTLAGHSDWRLPNAKELQSIVDYSRSPETTNSPAIDPMFETTQITDPNGQADWPYFWTSTTHLASVPPGNMAAYVAFGEAIGKVNNVLVDAHGAGAQRSDPKSGNPNDYPQYIGPQGDLQRVFNYVRAVRNAY